MAAYLESPMPGVFTGAAVAAIFFVIWTQTRKPGFLLGVLGGLLLAIALWFLEQAVVTDREQVETTIRELGARVERNELAELLQGIHPDAIGLADDVRMGMRYRFEDVVIKPMDVEVLEGRSPRQATAEFTAIVKVTEHPRDVPRFVRLTLQEQGGRWLLWEVTHDDVQKRFQKKPQP